jgi:hypothetical protein
VLQVQYFTLLLSPRTNCRYGWIVSHWLLLSRIFPKQGRSLKVIFFAVFFSSAVLKGNIIASTLSVESVSLECGCQAVAKFPK